MIALADARREPAVGCRRQGGLRRHAGETAPLRQRTGTGNLHVSHGWALPHELHVPAAVPAWRSAMVLNEPDARVAR